MIVATINRTFLAWITAIAGAEYILRWLPKGTHRYALLRKPAEITALLGKAGMTPTSWSGIRVNPFSRRFTLTADLSVNYMVCAVRSN